MNNIVESGEEDADASSPIPHLPDEIILFILNKLIDLKTLCFCYLVSRRFSLIVLDVDAISFAAHLFNPRIPNNNSDGDAAQSRRVVPPISSSFYGESFLSANTFLSKFKRVKSLCIELPSSSKMGNDNLCSFKWIAKFGNRMESCNKIGTFMCLSPNSILDTNGFCVKGNEEQGCNEVTSGTFQTNHHNSFYIAILWHTMLLELVKNLPMLEKVSITDLGKSGRVSLSGEKLGEVREWVHADPETVFNCAEGSLSLCHGCIPVMKLPETGYEMKWVYFLVRQNQDMDILDDLVVSEDDFEDKEEAAYSEALIDILRDMRTVYP